MKNRRLVLMAVLAAVACAAAQASDISVDVLSAYVWRGQVYTDEAVLQPGFTAETPFGLSLNAWLNMDLTDHRDTDGDIDEIDLTATYALPFGEEAPVSVEIGAATYTYPKDADFFDDDGELLAEDTDTSEAFLNIEGNCLLAPSLLVSYDVDKVDGLYVSIGLSHEQVIGEKFAVDASASVGYANADYNTYYFGTEELACDDDAFNDANVSLGATFSPTEALSLGASITYTMLLDSDIEDGAEANYGEKDLVYGGVNLSYTF